jgi:hypothetical protein
VDTTAYDRLADLLVAYFGDQSVPNGVREMIFVTRHSDQYHRDYRRTLTEGVDAVQTHDPELLTVIRRRYAPLLPDLDALGQILVDILAEYDLQFARANG